MLLKGLKRRILDATIATIDLRVNGGGAVDCSGGPHEPVGLAGALGQDPNKGQLRTAAQREP